MLCRLMLCLVVALCDVDSPLRHLTAHLSSRAAAVSQRRAHQLAMSAFRPLTSDARRLQLDFLSAKEPLPTIDDALLTPLLLLCAQWGIPLLADRSTDAAPALETTYYLPETALMRVFGVRRQ